MLAGNVTALLAPVVFVPILTFALGPDDYDYESMKAIRRGDDHDVAQEAGIDLELVPGERVPETEAEMLEQRNLTKAAFIARLLTVIMTICLLVLWPMPMFGSYVSRLPSEASSDWSIGATSFPRSSLPVGSP